MSDKYSNSFRMKVSVIASIFGKRWLENATEKPHPVRMNFRAIRPIIDSLFRNPDASLPRDLSENTAFTFIDELGTTLNYSMGLVGFNRQIAGRFLVPAEYNGAYYEARIASYHAKRGLDVRFIGETRDGPKGPDLRVVIDGRPVVVEAKYKDRLAPPAESRALLDLMRQLNDRGARECPPGVDVTAAYMGIPDERSYNASFNRVMQLVREGFRGTRVVSDPGLYLNVSQRIPIIGSITQAAVMESVGPRAAQILFEVNPDGSVREVGGATFGLFTLPGHTLEGIMKNIEVASSQIGRSGTGVVYIDVDAIGRPLDALQNYLLVLGYAVAARTWGGGRNTRIRVLVLSCGPFVSIEEEDGHKISRLRYASYPVYNSEIPHSPDDVDPYSIIKNILAHTPVPDAPNS